MNVESQTSDISWGPALEKLYAQLQPMSSERSILTGAALVDPQTERVILPSLVVIGDGGLLEYCGQPDPGLIKNLLSRNYTQWNFSGHLILPAFADAHVHVGMEFSPDTGHGIFSVDKTLDDLQKAFKSGIGFLRDCGNPGFSLVDLKKRLTKLDGPRLLTCGRPITTSRGHMHSLGLAAQGQTELKMAVEHLAGHGVDFIKICATGGRLTPNSDPTLTQYTTAEMKTVVNSAAEYGLGVVAHAHGTSGVQACIDAGVQWVEHCSFMEPGGGYKLDQHLLEKMAARGISMGFTLTQFKWNVSPKELKALEQGREVMPYTFFRRLLRAVQKAGINFVISSDGGIPSSPFGCLDKMLWAAREIYQVSDWEILKAVSTAPAGIWQEKGSAYSKGRRAALVAIRGDLEHLFKKEFEVGGLFMGKTAFSSKKSQNPLGSA